MKIVTSISKKLGLDRDDVNTIVDKFVQEIRLEMEAGNNVFIKNFAHFIVKKKPRKKCRDIGRNKDIWMPEHYIPFMRPCKAFIKKVRELKVD